MTDDEVRAFLRTRGTLVLATLDSNGSPVGDVARYRYENDGIYFVLPHDSRSLANIQRNDRVCCITEQFPSYYQIRWAAVYGRAREVTDVDTWYSLHGALGEGSRVSGDPAPDDAVLLHVAVEHTASADFSKIKQK